MAWDSKSGIDREELRAAILDLVRIAALWEGGALERGHAETRAADERLLGTIVKAITEHQSGPKSVPVGRVKRHVVRRLDLRLAQVHEEISNVLRACRTSGLDDDAIDRIASMFRSGGVKGATRAKIADATQRLAKGADTAKWIRTHRGPEQAAADLMSMVGPRSGRYTFLVRQFLAKQDDPSPRSIEQAARGKVVAPRELLAYMLGLLGKSPRAIARVLDVLYGPRGGRRK